ncbi:hypothetical protein ONS95_012669 [Cadophora gregata]|uniref:uncharacterized protein n=1 Tax=Cadophora gregata TaxID=51156 RepID=UPI0026DD1CBF|nr:uncharacterized protein ONS95_012669 [Cadophora gregata]KAK0118380.1 hypothetical protein ONS95_012669 [Cadophora gregata]KAK0123449.1 hypothetical protein ONS96_010433 [Cadophora gregata f. sp. sojae]
MTSIFYHYFQIAGKSLSSNALSSQTLENILFSRLVLVNLQVKVAYDFIPSQLLSLFLTLSFIYNLTTSSVINGDVGELLPFTDPFLHHLTSSTSSKKRK